MALMTLKYTAVDDVNYAVCGLCGSLSHMGQVYGPVFWVWPDEYDAEDRQNNSHKLQLCYGCYFDQWMEMQPKLEFPQHLRDGRVQVDSTKAPLPDDTEMVQGKGLTVVSNDEYVKWEHALKVAKVSNGAETVMDAYKRLYESGRDSVEVSMGSTF